MTNELPPELIDTSREAMIRLGHVKVEARPPVKALRTLYSWGAVTLALDLVTWGAAGDRTGLESPNYALQEATPAQLVQVAELLAFRVGLAAAGVQAVGADGSAGLERQVCSEALTAVQDEMMRRLDPPDNEPF